MSSAKVRSTRDSPISYTPSVVTRFRSFEETRAQMSRNGRRAVLTQYNPEMGEAKLLRPVETTVSRHV